MIAARHPILGHYQALACDGDGTLTTRKILARRTEAALDRWQESGRRLILVTGESVQQLQHFPEHRRFDLVVAENGAVIYHPASDKTKVLCRRRGKAALVNRLRVREVEPLKVGEVIISTERANEKVLHETIRELELDWCVLPNRHEVMALPRGIDKSTGLCTALRELNLPRRSVIGVGDAENDVALLRCCGLGVAVQSALPALKEHADLVLERGSGVGIVELIHRVLAEDTPSSRNSLFLQ